MLIRAQNTPQPINIIIITGVMTPIIVDGCMDVILLSLQK